MISNKANLYWACLIALYTLVHIFLLPSTWGAQSISDAGIFSYLTIALLLISLLLLIKSISAPFELKYKLPLFALAYAIVIYILREADFHRLFTDEHITKSKFYTDPGIDLQQKILGGVPMLLFFVCVFYLLATQLKLVLSSFIKKTPWAIALILWGLTFVASQLTDKSDLNDVYFGRVIEEMLELCASGYALLAIILSLALINNLPKRSLDSKN